MPPLSAALWVAVGLIVLVVHLTAVAFSNAFRKYSRSRLEDLCRERGRPGRAEDVFRLDEETETATGLIAVVSVLILAALLGGLLVRAEPRWLVDSLVAAVFLLGGVGYLGASIYGRVLAEDLLDRGWHVASWMRRLVSPLALVTGWVESFVEKRVQLGQRSRIGPRPASVEVEIHARSEEEATKLDAELPESARQMLENVVALLDKDAAALMTPRSNIITLPASTRILEAARVFAQSGLSRIPLYGEHRDDIVGVLYAKDLLPLLLEQGGETRGSVRKLGRPPYLVPETKNAAELLDELRQRRVQLAIVLDEYGSVAGLITLEDLLEQIVGPIDDEHDAPARSQPIVDLGGGRYEVDGSIDVEELNDRLHLGLPTDRDYQTVGGLAFDALGRVPEPGATFQSAGIDFTVLEVGDHAVRRLQLAREHLPGSSNGSGPH
jgi:CBS domain containing-hemolysin-like protein